MRIEMDRGRAPYEALRFALQLRPDVIFLLSDGEFPQGIEDLLREENKVENLFGNSKKGEFAVNEPVDYKRLKKVERSLENLNVNEVTPVEALNFLNSLKISIEGKGD